MEDKYVTNGLEDLEAWANGEGWWSMLLRRKYVEGYNNRDEWEKANAR